MISPRLRALCLLLLLAPGWMVQAAVQATVSRAELYLGESFDLVITSDDPSAASPDFSPLAADFEVVNTQRSQMVRIGGGQQSQESTWTVTLIPKRHGALQVPSVIVGKSATQPQQVLVREAQAGADGSPSEDVFVEAVAEPTQPYVQQHVLFTIKLYRAVDVNNATIDEPKAQPGVMRVEKLNDTTYTKQIQGRNYRVNELRYVLIPLQSRDIELPPTNFRGQARQPQRQVVGPDGLPRITGGGMANIARQAKAVTLHVRPVPAAFPSGANWLPAKSLSVRGGWAGNVAKAEVGAPLTYAVNLRAVNYLAQQINLPPLQAPPQFRSYEEPPSLSNQPDTGGFVASYVRNTALIPEQPGTHVIPQVEIPWWNVDTDSLEYARIAEASIEVAAGAAQPAPTVAPAAPTEAAEPVVVPPQQEETATTTTFSWLWLLLSAALLLAWLATLFLWHRERHGKSLQLQLMGARHRERIREVKTKLRDACQSGEPSDVRRLLLRWGQLQFHDAQLHAMSDLVRKLPQLQQPLEVMNKCLYQKRPQQWHGKELWRIVDETPTSPPPRPSELEPLHRV